MSDPEIVMSPLCREISGDGTRIQVDIYRGGNESGWTQEITNKENTSTVRDDPFNTDQEAFVEAMKAIEPYGIRSFLAEYSR